MSEDNNVSGEQNMEAAAPVETNVEQSQYEESNTGTPDGVPLSALQSEREQRQHLQEELRTIKDHLALMQSSQQRASAPPKDEFEGVDDSDVLTYGEAKKLLGKVQQNYQGSIEELKMTQKYPDYQEVIQRYLPEVLKTNPALRRSLEQTQDYELAYHLAKNSDDFKSQKKSQKKSLDAQRIVENSAQAGSLSSLGATSPISQARKYKDMKDDDFKALVNRNLGVI
jgi:hypothetical protein